MGDLWKKSFFHGILFTSKGVVSMPRKATINMVAERAGVSRGTVDRVLNGRPHVKPEIYDRIVKAMKELGYVPPREEQALALGLNVPSDRPIKLGVLLPNWSGYFKSEVMRGIRDAQALLKDYAAEVLIEACETDLPDESTERLERLLEQRVQGVAMCAKDHISITEKVNELYERGVPVVTFNSDLSNCRRLCFIGQDLKRGGRVAGELMSKYLRPDDNLLIAIGNPEFNAHRQRLQGFCECIYEHGFSGGKLEIIETYNDYSLTYQKVSDVLRRVPDVKGIYMANHSVTGCAEAIRDAGLQGQIHVISHDLTDATKRLLQSGEIDFAIAQNIYRQGYRPLIVLREYLQKQTLPSPDGDRPVIEIVCAENLSN